MQKEQLQDQQQIVNEQGQINNEYYKFLDDGNLTQEQLEKSINSLLSIMTKEKSNISLLSSTNENSIMSMINCCAKYNNYIFVLKFLVNLELIKNNINSNENIPNIDYNEYIIMIFKKFCEKIESAKNSLNLSEKSIPLSSIINKYEEILIYVSDYLSKEINIKFSLSIINKYIQKVVKENIYTFYIIYSITLYNLCKNFSNVNLIKEYINTIKINKIPLSSSSLNSYIDLLCRTNRLEECQSFFDEIISYKPLLTIPNYQTNSDENNTNSNPNESKAIYEKHISSFGINIISFGIFLKYLCKNDHLDLALFYFDQLNSKKMLRDEIIFNLILNGCSKKGDFGNLYRVYEEMLNNGIKPTNITMNTIIDAFI